MFTVCWIFALQRFDHSQKVRVENHVKAKCILSIIFVFIKSEWDQSILVSESQQKISILCRRATRVKIMIVVVVQLDQYVQWYHV